jgi:hypothetical protein
MGICGALMVCQKAVIGLRASSDSRCSRTSYGRLLGSANATGFRHSFIGVCPLCRSGRSDIGQGRQHAHIVGRSRCPHRALGTSFGRRLPHPGRIAVGNERQRWAKAGRDALVITRKQLGDFNDFQDANAA